MPTRLNGLKLNLFSSHTISYYQLINHLAQDHTYFVECRYLHSMYQGEKKGKNERDAFVLAGSEGLTSICKVLVP